MTNIRYLQKEIYLSEVLTQLKLKEKISHRNFLINSVSTLTTKGNKNTLQFSNHSIIEKPHSITIAPLKSICTSNIIRVSNPKEFFFAIITWLEKEIGFKDIFQSFVAKNAKIHKSAILEKSVYIGENTIIGAGSVIYPNVKIGENCLIGNNCVIGHSGFGVINGNKGIEMVPHIGGVLIGDNVRLGSLSTIDKGTIGVTSIGNNTKIDNKVHIAHNCSIGSSNIICAGVNLGGGVKIGNDCFLGLGCNVKQKINILDGTNLGIGSNVFHDTNIHSKMVGFPAKKLPK